MPRSAAAGRGISRCQRLQSQGAGLDSLNDEYLENPCSKSCRCGWRGRGLSSRVRSRVKRFSSVSRGVRSFLAEHFELFLTAVGVFVATGLIFADISRGERGLANVFLIWLQGFLIWAVHRHAWFRRRALVDKMRLMLQDRVNNQLTVMLGTAELRHREMTPAEKQDMDTATNAARTVAHEL